MNNGNEEDYTQAEVYRVDRAVRHGSHLNYAPLEVTND
jgi:hypothetical protein